MRFFLLILRRPYGYNPRDVTYRAACRGVLFPSGLVYVGRRWFGSVEEVLGHLEPPEHIQWYK